MERLWKPNVEISPACPRCGSSNTKFCYYNNYSLTQPRYFCKGCRRYWTRGGSLRNVPIGGGCRKSRRGKSIRVSTDRLRNSRALAHGSNALGQSGGLTSSSVVPDGPNIDLALVYNNFLNQNPEPERVELPVLPVLPVLPNVDLSIEFGNLEEMSMEFSTHLPLENGGTNVECPNLSKRSSEAHLSDFNAIYNCGYQLTHQNNQQEAIQEFACNHVMNIDYGLAPLPGEEEGSQEMGWSNRQILGTDHMLHATQMQGIEPEVQVQVQDQFIGDKGDFDLSNYGNFFRP